VLTTPNAAFLDPDDTSPTTVAALAPGFHGFLFSPRSLEALLQAAGLPHVQIQGPAERIVAWASREPLALDGSDWATGRREYLAYLADRVATLPDHASSLWQGFAYRYLRDLANAGDGEGAARVARALCDAIIGRYGAAALDPDATTARMAGVTSLAAAGAVAPFFTPCLYFHLGAIAEHAFRDPREALRYYRGAHALTLACVRGLGSVTYLEPISLVWPARAAEARLRLATGDFAGAAGLLRAMADDSHRTLPEHAYARPAPALVEQALPAGIETMAAAGRHDLAAPLVDAYRRYVSRSYGERCLTPAGLEGSLARGEGVPLDPLFLPFIAGLQGAAQGEKDKAARLLREVARIGRAFARHPTAGQACATRASAAEKLLPAPPRVVLFESTFTFKR
jgi:hypothetical protein